jgi:hypothetical protein
MGDKNKGGMDERENVMGCKDRALSSLVNWV